MCTRETSGQRWHQDLPDGGLDSQTGGLNNRIKGIFLCIRTQFFVKNSPTDTKFFPYGSLTLPDEGATAPLSLACASECNHSLWALQRLQALKTCHGYNHIQVHSSICYYLFSVNDNHESKRRLLKGPRRTLAWFI